LSAVIEESGVLVPPENLQKLTQAILSLAQDASLRENLGKLGLQFVHTHWEKELVLEGLLSKLRYNTVRQAFKERN